MPRLAPVTMTTFDSIFVMRGGWGVLGLQNHSEVDAPAGSGVVALEELWLLSFPIREFQDPSKLLHVGERGRNLLLIQGRIIASSVAPSDPDARLVGAVDLQVGMGRKIVLPLHHRHLLRDLSSLSIYLSRDLPFLLRRIFRASSIHTAQSVQVYLEPCLLRL